MAKFNVDDILSDLGIDTPEEAEQQHAPRTRDKADDTPHKVDKAESSFTPLPSVPSNQRSFDTSVIVEHDPAVPVPPQPSRASSVGASLQQIYTPPGDTQHPTLRDRLLEAEAATPKQITAAEQVVKQSADRRLVEVLIEQGADEQAVQSTLARHTGLDFERIDLQKGFDGGFDGTILQRLTPEFCKAQQVIPLRVEGKTAVSQGRLVLGMALPSTVFTLDDARRKVGFTNIKVVVVTPSDILSVIDMTGGADDAENVDVSELLSDVDEGDVEVEKAAATDSEVDLEKQADEGPVIRYVNYIIQTAIKEGASDIHIEPADKKLRVRFRIDGELFEMMNPPHQMSAAITSRLKIMANLDIAERRVPQDGRIRCTVQGRKLDLRASTLPTGYGEKTVLRILDTKSINVELEDLGFDDNTYQIWKKQIKNPHGIILVTGPTGSGKTTTLYSSLRQLDKSALNISTVEDPIEYHLDGVTQTATHDKIGMTFGKALKALLRQDPDVIMLGEIRDMETATIAVQASLTGHLVLSTLHTNDAPSSITRLVNIGLEPFLVGAAVNAVLAQRLVRRICPHCKEEVTPSEDMAEFLEMHGLAADTMSKGRGCDKCRNIGYSGRLGLYELLTTDDQLRDIIARNPNVSEFRRLCIERGMVPLRQDGMNKVAAGRTTVDEILRVTDGNH